jgi:hypothetical protein
MFVSAKRTFAAVSALAVATIAVGSLEAKAEAWRCGRSAGYNICAIDRGHVDSIKINWTNGDYTWMKVICGRKTFEIQHGSQYISSYNANRVATQWCFG